MADLPKEYQQRVVDALLDPSKKGVIAMHGTGTGKSRTSAEARKALQGMPATFVVPAALQANILKELDKWDVDPSSYKVVSQQAVARKGLGDYDPKGGLLVIDESQKAKNVGSALTSELKKSQASKRLLLSATPWANSPEELAAQVNLAAGKDLLPTGQTAFRNQFLTKKVRRPTFKEMLKGVPPVEVTAFKNQGKLRPILQKYVDYYQNPDDTPDFPRLREEEIPVEMGSRQSDIYKTIMDQSPAWVQRKVQKNLPPSKRELEKLRAFLGGARQVSNTTQPFTNPGDPVEAPKVEKAVEELKKMLVDNPRGKAVVYSNYIDSGLKPYKTLLDEAGIPYGEFTGEINEKVRDELVKQYNEDKLKALLISSAGAEGLDLKGTRLIQLLEPHFNISKEKQIIGRGRRYKSHAHLPEDERDVLVQRFFSRPQAGIIGKLSGKSGRGTDEYIRNLAREKADIGAELEKLIRERPSLLQRLRETLGNEAD